MTMEEIAEKAGCARSTVHAAISGKNWVSEKTRKKVFAVIKENNWKPNMLASGLSRGRTNLIALIMKDLQNPFSSEIIEGAESVLSETGYSCLMMNTNDNHEREIEAVKAALSYNVEGIIITPQQLDTELGHLWELQQNKLPFVSLGEIPGVRTSYIDLDEISAADISVNYLKSLGHSRIVHFRGPSTSLAAKQRADGFRSAMLKAGLNINEDSIIDCGSTEEDGLRTFRAAAELFRSSTPPTAVFCYNDLCAAGVYTAAEEQKIKIPEDISVIGVDNISLSSVFGPPLTTINQPCRQMGEALASTLIKGIKNKNNYETIKLQFSPELIIRKSVKTLN